MTDREKVKKGLDLCLTGEPSKCKDCPYDAECKEARGIGPSPLRGDAMELLKHDEQTIASLQSTINKLTKAIEEQPKQKFFVDSDGKITPLPIQPQWISIEDRMPDKQPCEYLVVNGNNVETAICLDNMWITPRRVTKITHWMPLPEPPKEVKQDG